MSSISEESETGDDDHLDDEFIVCNNNNDNIDHRDNNDHGIKQREQNVVPSTLAVETCLGDLNTFKQVSNFLRTISFKESINKAFETYLRANCWESKKLLRR